MLYKRKHHSNYHPLKVEDAKYFYDIPLLKYINKDSYNGKIHICITLIGFYRKERISFTVPIYNWARFSTYGEYQDYINTIVIKSCMEKWPLEDPFSYVCIYKLDDFEMNIRYPEKFGDIVPDWKSAREALRVTIRTETDDRDALFVSLYNEALRINIANFRSKYKAGEKASSTERILKITNVPQDVKRFICRVRQPTIERETGNTNKNTFDFIRIRISIPTKDAFENRKEFIINNMKYFVYVSLNKIESLKHFSRYGVPITCLSLKKSYNNLYQ